jgi:hypothetical protein
VVHLDKIWRSGEKAMSTKTQQGPINIYKRRGRIHGRAEVANYLYNIGEIEQNNHYGAIHSYTIATIYNMQDL